MTKEFNTKISQGSGDEQHRPGGRLGLLVNRVCDVMELRRNLKEMSFLADFFRAVNSSLILEDVLEAASSKIFQYFPCFIILAKKVNTVNLKYGRRFQLFCYLTWFMIF